MNFIFNVNEKSKPTISIEHANGTFVVICDKEKKIVNIVDPLPFGNSFVDGKIGFNLIETGLNYNLETILKNQGLRLRTLSLNFCSIFVGEINANIFKTDICLMFRGKILGCF